MATAQRHTEISRIFLRHAEEEFQKGDLLQAAEKAWGAVAHCVNAIALERGWPVGSHRLLVSNARRIIGTDEENAPRLRLLLRAVESLHVNFYKEFLLPEEVREGIENAGELVTALKILSDSMSTSERARMP